MRLPGDTFAQRGHALAETLPLDFTQHQFRALRHRERIVHQGFGVIFLLVLDGLLDVRHRHAEAVLVTVFGGLHFDDIGDREQRQLAQTLAAHDRATFGRLAAVLHILVTTAIADAQVLSVQVFDGHADAVVLDLDPFVVRIDANLHARRIRIPCVGHRFGKDSGDVAIEVDAEVFEDVEIDGHLELVVRPLHSSPPRYRPGAPHSTKY